MERDLEWCRHSLRDIGTRDLCLIWLTISSICRFNGFLLTFARILGMMTQRHRALYSFSRCKNTWRTRTRCAFSRVSVRARARARVCVCVCVCVSEGRSSKQRNLHSGIICSEPLGSAKAYSGHQSCMRYSWFRAADIKKETIKRDRSKSDIRTCSSRIAQESLLRTETSAIFPLPPPFPPRRQKVVFREGRVRYLRAIYLDNDSKTASARFGGRNDATRIEKGTRDRRAF